MGTPDRHRAVVVVVAAAGLGLDRVIKIVDDEIFR